MARTTQEGPASTSRDRTLSAVLRAAHEKAKTESGLSLRALAAQVGTTHSTLHRWFNGRGVPGYEDVVSIVAALGIVGDEKEAILDMARNPGPNLVTTGPPGVSQQLAGVMELERTAESMTEWSPLAVPGMLQTANYARSVIGTNEARSGGEVEHLVTLRLGRQNAILRDNPIQFTALIGWPAIAGSVGSPNVMAEQLRYMERASKFEAVTIRIVQVDEGWHDGLLGPFVQYDFPGHPSIVHLEHHRSGIFLDEEQDVEAYRHLAQELRDLAMSPDESREIIGRQIAKLEKTT
jgi:transcriptional regulator with XRE-family HTH domain